MSRKRNRKLTKNQWLLLQKYELRTIVNRKDENFEILQNIGFISINIDSKIMEEVAIITSAGKDYLANRREALKRNKEVERSRNKKC